MSNLQYLQETRLIERIGLIEIGFCKQAGAASSILSGAASTLSDWGKKHVDTSSPTSVVSSLADLLIPGVLFKIHPAFGILASIGEALGFSPVNIVKKVLSLLSGKLEQNQLPTMGEINQVGKDMIEGEAGSLDSHGWEYPLFHLQKLSDNGLFSLMSQGRSNLPNIPFLGGSGNQSVLTRIFGNLLQSPTGASKAKWLLGGFVIWILKSVLLGAGLVAGAEGISKIFQGSGAKSETTPTATSGHTDIPTGAAMEIMLTPTGKGTDVHANDKNSLWFVPIVGGSVENTLTQWAGYVYKELQSPSISFSAVPSFQKTVQEMRSNFSPGTGAMQVPSQFKSIKQVVDQFAMDVWKKIKGI